MHKKSLISGYFNKNLGDDLFVKVISEILPQTDFTCIVYDVSLVDSFREFNNVNTWLYSKFKRRFDRIHELILGKTFFLRKKLMDYDNTILLGGSMFIEDEYWKDKKRFSDWLLRESKSIYVLGSNFGPYRSQEFLMEYRDFFRKVSLASFRDRKSKEWFNDLPNCQYAPDIVFGLKVLEHQKERKLGISVMDLSGRDDISLINQIRYEELIVRISESFIKNNYSVVLYSFCNNQGDLRKCLQIKEKIVGECVKVVAYEGDTSKFLNDFAKCEYVLATRFHSMILGWINHAKTLPCIYSDKTEEVLSDLNCIGKSIDLRKTFVADMNDFEEWFVEFKSIDDIVKQSSKHFEWGKSH